MKEENRIIRTKELTKIVGISRSTIWRLENKNLFPKKRRIGDDQGAVGYLHSEVMQWMDTRQQAKKDEQMQPNMDNHKGEHHGKR